MGSSYSERVVRVVFSLPKRNLDEEGCLSILTTGAVIGESGWDVRWFRSTMIFFVQAVMACADWIACIFFIRSFRILLYVKKMTTTRNAQTQRDTHTTMAINLE